MSLESRPWITDTEIKKLISSNVVSLETLLKGFVIILMITSFTTTNYAWNSSIVRPKTLRMLFTENFHQKIIYLWVLTVSLQVRIMPKKKKDMVMLHNTEFMTLKSMTIVKVSGIVLRSSHTIWELRWLYPNILFVEIIGELRLGWIIFLICFHWPQQRRTNVRESIFIMLKLKLCLINHDINH